MRDLKWVRENPEIATASEVLELYDTITEGVLFDRLEEICNAERLIGKTVYCAFDGVNKIIERQISGYVANPGIMLLADYGHGFSNNLCGLEAIDKTVFVARPNAVAALKKDKDKE
jgi:hypothetical protein